MSVVEVLAVIPARGGSQGLPGKNLRLLNGTSLVARAVHAAQEARLVSRVVGSTDDPAIATELVAHGAEVPVLRPADLASSTAPDSPVFLHMLDILAAGGYEPDIVVNIRPTAPLRTAADIDGAVKMLIDHRWARSVKSVSAADEHPYKMWTIEGGIELKPLLPEWHTRFGGDVDMARQRLPVVYRSNGAVDATWVASLRRSGTFHPGPIAAFIMEHDRAIDVDSAEHLALAERHLTQEHP